MMAFLLLQDTTAIRILGNQVISFTNPIPLQHQEACYIIMTHTSSIINAPEVAYNIMTLVSIACRR